MVNVKSGAHPGESHFLRYMALCDGLTHGRTRRGGGVVVEIFLDDKTSASDFFNSCSFIPHAHFETSLVMVSYYSY